MSDPKMTMEVPPQVRDFAVKSVDQAVIYRSSESAV
jgi:hypothetical protein